MTRVTGEDDVRVYVRSSTERQESEHQWESIQRWRGVHDVTDDQVETHADVGSGASTDDRPEFRELVDAVESGSVDHVVTWEVSRLSRERDASAVPERV